MMKRLGVLVLLAIPFPLCGPRNRLPKASRIGPAASLSADAQSRHADAAAIPVISR